MILRTDTRVVRGVHADAGDRPGPDRAARAGNGRPTPARRGRRRRDSAACCRSSPSSPSRPRTRPTPTPCIRACPRWRACSRPAGWPFSPTPARWSCRSRAPSTPSNSKPRPQALGSHNDQQSTWQALGPEGRQDRLGRPPRRHGRERQRQCRLHQHLGLRQRRVLGRRRRRSSTRSAATARRRSAASPARCSARRRHRRRCARSSPPTTSTCSRRSTARSSTARSPRRRRSRPRSSPRRSPAPTQYFQPSSGNNANNGLAQQLQTVARVIGARSALGAKRQVFFVVDGRLRHPRHPERAARPT